MGSAIVVSYLLLLKDSMEKYTAKWDYIFMSLPMYKSKLSVLCKKLSKLFKNCCNCGFLDLISKRHAFNIQIKLIFNLVIVGLTSPNYSKCTAMLFPLTRDETELVAMVLHLTKASQSTEKLCSSCKLPK